MAMLPVKIQNAAIVVLSASNNPRLLNGDFLKRHQIVPEEWVVTDTLVTPPVAQVTFENGLQVLVEENRLHFQANRPEDFPWAEELPRAAVAYMELLPHANYGGVGLNFIYTSDEPYGEAAEETLIRKLLKRGPWLKCGAGITGAVLELQYRKDLPQMNVKIGVLESVGPKGKKLEGLIFNVNFHHDFQADQLKERAAYVRSMDVRQKEFFHLLETLPF